MRTSAPEYRYVNNIWGHSSQWNFPRQEALKPMSLFCPVSRHEMKPWSLPQAWSVGQGRKSLFHKNSEHTFPKEPQRTKPGNLLATAGSMTDKHYHVANCHHRDYEIATVKTNDPWPRDNNRRRQHFVQGQVAGGSASNSLVYGTSELLREAAEEKQSLLTDGRHPVGFMYGTEAATKVGQHVPNTKPNNALMLEERTEKDAERFKKLAFDKDEFLTRHYNEKAMQRAQHQEEKRKDLEMLKSYTPWGKPGAGAPRLKTEEAPDTHIAGSMNEIAQEPTYMPYGAGGGGAPNRTDSGKVVTTFRPDPELRLTRHANIATVEPSLRYGPKNASYGKELDAIIDDSRTRKEIRRQRSFEEELRHINQDPYGKPGAGAPVRNSRGSVRAGFPTTLSRDIEELRKVEPRHGHAYNPGPVQEENHNLNQSSPRTKVERYDPWGRGHGNPSRTESGRVMRTHRSTGDEDLVGLGIQIGRPGAGAPNKDENGNLSVRKPQTLAKTQTGQTFQRDFSAKGYTYDPFGRPGAGAPIRDREGNVVTQTAGKVEHDVLGNSPTGVRGSQGKQEYLKTLQSMSEEAKHQRRLEQDEIRTGSKDVASWLRGGVVGQPNYDPLTKEIRAGHKSTSDVTQQKLNIRRQRNDQSITYHHDLEMLAEERHQQRRREREAEHKESQQHVNTMNSLWGKPGAGAPLSQDHVVIARKQRLGLDPTDHSYRYRDV